jgi:predicted MFS family arabinose efflux permease
MSFSLAHILSAKMGMAIIEYFGYQTNWLFMGILGVLGMLAGLWVFRLIQKENK